jgi:hypothetical protein
MAAWEHLDKIVEIVKSGPPALQLRAWELLATRGYGPPKREIDVTSKEESKLPPVIYAQPPSQTPEEWVARHTPKRKDQTEH